VRFPGAVWWEHKGSPTRPDEQALVRLSALLIPKWSRTGHAKRGLRGRKAL
jgi:hypothetical protein